MRFDILALIVIFVAIIGFLAWPSFITFIYNENNRPILSAVSSFMPVVTASISLVNLYFVIHFFFKDKVIKIDERKISNRNLLFRQLILEKNVDKIYNFFEGNIKIIEDYFELNSNRDSIEDHEYSKKIKELIDSYNDDREKLGHSFVDLVESFHKDFSQYLYDLLDEFQDEFNNQLAFDELDKKEFIKIVYKHRQQFLKRLYDFGINDCILEK